MTRNNYSAKLNRVHCLSLQSLQSHMNLRYSMTKQRETLWSLFLRKTLEEKQALTESKQEIQKENTIILQTMLFAVASIFGGCYLSSFNSDFFSVSGIEKLKYAFLFVFIFAGLLFLYVKFFPTKHITLLIYIVNSLIFLYSILVNSFISPESVGISFIVALFIASTLYLDYGWRIHLFMTVATVASITVTSFYKPEDTHAIETMNSIIVLILLFLIGTILRSAHLNSFIATHALQKAAYTDQLMGIRNRRSFFEDLAEFETGETLHRISAIAILDLDNFKLFNDTYGHQSGDNCLKKIGEVLLGLEKKHNIRCYRYGGEEFTVLFINSGRDEISSCTTSILEGIHALEIPHSGSVHQVMTASIGVTYIVQGYSKFQSALSVADTALYKAKKEGKNLAIFSEFSADNPKQTLTSSIIQ